MTKLQTLESDFQPEVQALMVAVEKATGRKWGISDARRTIEQQRTIYAQGRTAPGKVVTMAKPGFSPHNFGYAVDLWPLTASGNDFDWGAPQSLFKQLADIARGMGLTAGFYFKSIHDAPHIESPKWKQQQALWLAGKLHVA